MVMTKVKSKLRKLTACLAAGALVTSGLAFERISFNETVKAADVCEIDSNTKYQTIKGFGGMNHPEWQGSDLTDAQVQKAFGNGSNELGLSILRIFVNDNSSYWQRAVPTAKRAQALGATVFATPWNPPESMRDKGSGGAKGGLYVLRNGSESAYAQHLNSFVKYVEGQGIKLNSISVQNEPDYASEWTAWDPDRAANFIANYGQAIKNGTNTKLMSPESFQYSPESWGNGKKYYRAILNNQKALTNTDLFGTHFYGTTRSQMDFPDLEKSGKEIWMTEVYVPNSEANSCNRFPEAVKVASNIHNGLVMGNMSAYVWWYIRRSYGLLDESGNITKRGAMMGQYSKFVRPGAVRIGCTEVTDKSLKDTDGNPAILISAYKKDDTITIVAVNDSDTGFSQNFSLKNEKNIKNIDRYRTDANENFGLTKNLENSNGSFWAQLPARSVSTFVVTVGDGSSQPANTQPSVTEPVVTTTTKAAVQPVNNVYFCDTFEGTVSDWTARGGNDVGLSGRTFTEGKESLLVQNRTASWNGATKKLGSEFVPGKEYSFSSNVCYLDGTNSVDSFYMKLQYKGSDGETHYSQIAEAKAVKGEWVQLANKNYKLPSDAENIELYIETAESTNNFYIDEISGAVAGTEIKGAGEGGDIMLGDMNGDGKINVIDLLIMKRTAKNKVDNSRARLCADLDQSQNVNGDDVKMMINFLHGKLKKFAEIKQSESDPQPTSEPSSSNSKHSDNPPSYMDEIASQMVSSLPNGAADRKSNVNYGDMKKITYFSQTAGRNTPAYVLTPPNYDPSKKYPVLYMMHGYYEDETRFTADNKAYRYILGNLEAEGKAEEMIVVFPYIYTSKTREKVTVMDLENSLAYDNFVNDLKTDLMPYIEKNYSVRTDREGRAITGFSMGGRESLFIGTTCHDLFGYVGAACPAPGLTPLNPSTHPGQIQENEAKHNDLYMLLITGGTDDKVVYSNPKDYYNLYIKNGSKAIYNEIPGGEHWDNTIEPHFYNLVRFIFKG